MISVPKKESGLAELFTQNLETSSYGQTHLFVPSQMLLIIAMIHPFVICPSIWLPIDMVAQFPIDYMHQLCLGVMRKLLLTWTKGNRGVRISSRHMSEISDKLINLRSAIPSNFAPKPRGLMS